ncbi:MAG: response regulator [Candidatus Sumerlaeota bacterium]|nr:response regulator [Candidatus Sumerlaeota bacterium]
MNTPINSISLIAPESAQRAQIAIMVTQRFPGIRILPHSAWPDTANMDGSLVIADLLFADLLETLLCECGNKGRLPPPVIVIAPQEQEERLASIIRSGSTSYVITDTNQRWLVILEALIDAIINRYAVLKQPEGIQTIPSRKLRNILAVDDDFMSRTVFRTILSKLGYQYVLVENGAEAVEAARRQTFGLILMDAQMPVMDGFTATREIRALALQPQPVIICVSAFSHADEHEHCISAGMDGWLNKPIDLKSLSALIAKHFQTGKETPAAQGIPEPGIPTAKEPSQTAAASASEGVCGDAELYDATPLKELWEMTADDDPDFVPSLVRNLLKDFPPVLARMRETAAAGDTQGCYAAAHMYESRTGNLGARRMQAICHLIQQKVKKGDCCGLVELTAELSRVYDSTRPLLLEAYPAASDNA